jgi:hypothetical protein
MCSTRTQPVPSLPRGFGDLVDHERTNLENVEASWVVLAADATRFRSHQVFKKELNQR